MKVPMRLVSVRLLEMCTKSEYFSYTLEHVIGAEVPLYVLHEKVQVHSVRLRVITTSKESDREVLGPRNILKPDTPCCVFMQGKTLPFLLGATHG